MDIFKRITAKRYRIAAWGRSHARGYGYAALTMLLIGLLLGESLMLDMVASPLVFFASACALAACAASALSLIAGATYASFLRVVWLPPDGVVLLADSAALHPAACALAPVAIFAPLPAVPRRVSHR